MTTKKIPEDHFKPYVPNPNTKLGRAYLYAVKESEQPLLATEANFLRENPLIWLRAISLYSNNLDFLIKLAKTRLKAMAPLPGKEQSIQTPAYMQEIREHKKWSIVQEHKLQKIRARRAELIVELGFQRIHDAIIVGDAIGAFVDILNALQHQDTTEARRLAAHWIYRLSGEDSSDPDPAPEPVVEQVKSDEGLAALLATIRGGSDGDAAQG